MEAVQRAGAECGGGPVNLDHSQSQAVVSALLPGDRIITGGAGTGKTTVIKAINQAFGETAILMAPTGKAAARIREATGYDARTIHSELQYDGGRFRRQCRFDRPVIIDEASMIEAPLMAKLLDYHPPKLILVGDASQLPPVGHGSPFHDLIDIMPERTSRLDICHRASGAVHMAASAIREGRAPEPVIESGGERWAIRNTGGPERTSEVLRGWLEKGVVDPERDIIIAPRYGGEDEEKNDGGIHAINRLVKSVLNPSDGECFAPGDRAICTKNFPKDDLWNGDLVTVADINAEGVPEIRLDREVQNPEDLEPPRTRFLKKDQAATLQLAYCLSVHKSQGSQFRNVIFVVHAAHANMLNRSLIYTAVTRARKACVVIGEPAVFYRGINTVERRRTVLQHVAGVL